MIVEAAILDRDHRLDHARRNRAQRYVAPFLAPFDQRREQRRIHRHFLDRLALRHRLDAGERPGDPLLVGREGEAQRLAGAIAAARNHRERVTPDGEFPGLLDARLLRIAEIVEPIDHLAQRDALPLAHRQRPREDARIGARELAVHARVEQPREGDVVVSDGAGGDQCRQENGQRGVELPAAPPQESQAP